MTTTSDTATTRVDEIRAREQAATPGPWGTYYDNVVYDIVADLQPNSSGYSCRRQIAELRDEPIDNDPAHRDWTAEQDNTQIYRDATFITYARRDVPFLLTELADTQLIRDFHQTSERHLADKRDAAEEVLSEWEAGSLAPEKALRMIRAALAVGEVKTIQQLRKETPEDPRLERRIYIDGEGDPWIEIPMSPDDGSVAIVQLREDTDVAAPAEEIRANTGGLREIGRCA